MTKERRTNEPWLPTKVEDATPRIRISGVISREDVRAISNCYQGKASEYEQRLAMHAIMYSIARMSDRTYHRGPNGATDSAFSEGMRKVGQEVQKFCELSSMYLKSDNDKPE